MIAWLSNYLLRVLLKNEIIETDKIEIYQYGYEIMISTIITFLIVLISGIILDCLPAAILYFLIFAVMRQIYGGYHAQHYWSCNTLFAVVTVSVLLLFKFFPMDGIGAIHYTFLLFSVLVVFVYAPVENENKPISEKRKVLFRKISRIIAILLTLISCLIDIFHNPYVKLIDSTLLAISISILVVGLEERRECSEKRKEEHSEGCCESRCEKC